jgi:TRAP-type C4-dicarboxylate transport system substrate-binding protein
MCAHPDSWNALPQKVKDSVDRNAKKYVALFREDMVKANAEAAGRLKSRLVFNEADTSTFVERLKQNGFYNRWRREFGAKAWSLLETQRGPLP